MAKYNDKTLVAEDFEDETVFVNGNDVKVGSEINDGGEGYVYHVKSSESEDVSDSDVVKILNKGVRHDKEPKIEAMNANPPVDKTHSTKGTRSIVWPQKIVRERPDGPFLGYTMPYIDIDDKSDAWEHATLNLSHDNSDFSFNDRVKTALNLAIMVYNIHQAGHAIGDFNDKNIRVNDECHITLIDCDGFHITGQDGTVYPESVRLPEYAPPEGRGETVSEVKEADRFSMGVHIFKFFMEGEHPYQAELGDAAINGSLKEKIDAHPFPYGQTDKDIAPSKQKQQKYDQLPEKLRDLFERCFPDRDSDIPIKIANSNRPSPLEWMKTLGEISDESDLEIEEGSETTESESGSEPGGNGEGPKTGELDSNVFGDDGNNGNDDSQSPSGDTAGGDIASGAGSDTESDQDTIEEADDSTAKVDAGVFGGGGGSEDTDSRAPSSDTGSAATVDGVENDTESDQDASSEADDSTGALDSDVFGEDGEDNDDA